MGTYIQNLDQITGDRLRRLANVPIDTSRLERWLCDVLAGIREHRRKQWPWYWRSVVGVAAALLMTVIARSVFVEVADTPAVATAASLARMHHDVPADDQPTEPAYSVAGANLYLATQWATAPKVSLPTAASLVSYHGDVVRDRRVVCLYVSYKGRAVTAVVGNSHELVCRPDQDSVTHDGPCDPSNHEGNLQMVMVRHGQYWACMMGNLSPDELNGLGEAVLR